MTPVKLLQFSGAAQNQPQTCSWAPSWFVLAACRLIVTSKIKKGNMRAHWVLQFPWQQSQWWRAGRLERERNGEWGQSVRREINKEWRGRGGFSPAFIHASAPLPRWKDGDVGCSDEHPPPSLPPSVLRLPLQLDKPPANRLNSPLQSGDLKIASPHL